MTADPKTADPMKRPPMKRPAAGRTATIRFAKVARLTLALSALVAAGVAALPLSADAHDRRGRCWETNSGRVVCSRSADRRTPDEREYDRARANAADPGGSFAAYPDWARYALGQSKGRN